MRAEFLRWARHQLEISLWNTRRISRYGLDNAKYLSNHVTLPPYPEERTLTVLPYMEAFRSKMAAQQNLRLHNGCHRLLRTLHADPCQRIPVLSILGMVH